MLFLLTISPKQIIENNL